MCIRDSQCYVVCPAIEKNEDYEMRNVTDIYQGMQASLGRRYQIGLLHGKMSAQEKDCLLYTSLGSYMCHRRLELEIVP